jgi:hypothetical protein
MPALFDYQPNVKYPFALRLANALMLAGDQAGQFVREKQTDSELENRQQALYQQLVQHLATLDETRRGHDLVDQQRKDALDLKRETADTAAAEDRDTNTFLQRLTKARQAKQPIDESLLQGLKVGKDLRGKFLESLLPKPFDLAQGAKRYDPSSGSYEPVAENAPKAERMTGTDVEVLAAQADRKLKAGTAYADLSPEEKKAYDAFNLSANKQVTTSAYQGYFTQNAPLGQPGAAPSLPNVFGGGGGTPTPPGQAPSPTPGPQAKGPSILEEKATQEINAKAAAERNQPLGKEAAFWIDKETGLPVPPTTTGNEANQKAIPISAAQYNQVAAARRGLVQLQGFLDSGAAGLFPEAPFKGKGLGALVGNTARAMVFPAEARVRAMSDRDFSDYRTRTLAAIPALAKAAGDVGNLSQPEQDRVAESLSGAKTREAFLSSVEALRDILIKGFESNGLPVPKQFRPGGDAGNPSGGLPPGVRVRRIQ